jgi:hypothetical protein
MTELHFIGCGLHREYYSPKKKKKTGHQYYKKHLVCVWVIASLCWHGCQFCHTRVSKVMVITDVTPTATAFPLLSQLVKFKKLKKLF